MTGWGEESLRTPTAGADAPPAGTNAGGGEAGTSAAGTGAGASAAGTGAGAGAAGTGAGGGPAGGGPAGTSPAGTSPAGTSPAGTSPAGTSPAGASPVDPGSQFGHEVLAVVLRVRRGQLEVLLWQRAVPPFEGQWSLPCGPLGAGERLGTSAGRHLAAKVDITGVAHLEQLETRSDPGRDPRGRVLATAYLALVATDAEPALPADTAWHPVAALPPVAFDHESIIGSARERLRAKLSYTNIGFALAPGSFTIAQLRDIYAAALGHPVSATNLQRILTRRGVIVPTPARHPPAAAGGRPAALYRFAASSLVITNPFAAFRPRRPTSAAPGQQAGPLSAGR